MSSTIKKTWVLILKFKVINPDWPDILHLPCSCCSVFPSSSSSLSDQGSPSLCQGSIVGYSKSCIKIFSFALVSRCLNVLLYFVSTNFNHFFDFFTFVNKIGCISHHRNYEEFEVMNYFDTIRKDSEYSWISQLVCRLWCFCQHFLI